MKFANVYIYNYKHTYRYSITIQNVCGHFLKISLFLSISSCPMFRDFQKVTVSSFTVSKFHFIMMIDVRERGEDDELLNSKYFVVPILRMLMSDKDGGLVEELVKLLTILRRRGELAERCRRALREEDVAKRWHDDSDDEMKPHILQILLTEPIGTGRPRLDMERTIKNLLSTKRRTLLRYAILSDPERMQDVLSILIRHFHIDKVLVKEILEYMCDLSESIMRRVRESLLNAKIFPELIVERSKDSLRYVYDHLVQVPWIWHSINTFPDTFLRHDQSITSNERLQIICRVLTSKDMKIADSDQIVSVMRQHSTEPHHDTNLLLGTALVLVSKLKEPSEKLLKLSRNMMRDSDVLRKIFALQCLLRKRDDAQNDLSFMLEIWTGLRCMSLSMWFDRRVTKHFVEQLLNQKSRPEELTLSGFVSETIILLHEDLSSKRKTAMESKTWFVNEFLALASPNKISHISKLLVLKYAELQDNSMERQIKDKYLSSNSSTLTWSAALSVLFLRHSSTRSKYFQIFVDVLAKSRWPECTTDSCTKLIVDELLPNEQISRTALKLRRELETCTYETSSATTTTKQMETELLNSIQESVDAKIVTQWNVFNRTQRFSQSFSIRTLNCLCKHTSTTAVENPLQLLRNCCNSKLNFHALKIMFRSFRNLMIWDHSFCDDTFKVIEIVLKLSYLDRITTETRSLILDFVQYLIESEHVGSSILESCLLFPSVKFCVCKTFESSRHENNNIERVVLQDLVRRCPMLARSSFQILCNTKNSTIEFSRLACLVAILESSFTTFTFEDLDLVVSSLFRILRHVLKTRRMFEHGESNCFSCFVLNTLNFVRVLSQDDRGGPGMKAVRMLMEMVSGKKRTLLLDRRFLGCLMNYLSEMTFEQVCL